VYGCFLLSLFSRLHFIGKKNQNSIKNYFLPKNKEVNIDLENYTIKIYKLHLSECFSDIVYVCCTLGFPVLPPVGMQIQ
jgi:hypothetical protein